MGTRTYALQSRACFCLRLLNRLSDRSRDPSTSTSHHLHSPFPACRVIPAPALSPLPSHTYQAPAAVPFPESGSSPVDKVDEQKQLIHLFWFLHSHLSQHSSALLSSIMEPGNTLLNCGVASSCTLGQKSALQLSSYFLKKKKTLNAQTPFPLFPCYPRYNRTNVLPLKCKHLKQFSVIRKKNTCILNTQVWIKIEQKTFWFLCLSLFWSKSLHRMFSIWLNHKQKTNRTFYTSPSTIKCRSGAWRGEVGGQQQQGQYLSSNLYSYWQRFKNNQYKLL